MLEPFFEQDGLAIYCGNNSAVLPRLPAGGFDLVFTSPPYNLGNTTGGGFPDRFGHYRKSTGLSGRGGGNLWKGGELAAGYGDHSDNMPHDEYVAWQGDVLNQLWRVVSDDGAIFYNHKPRILDGQLISPADYVPAELKPYIRQEIIWQRAGGINFSEAFYLPTHERILVIAKRDWRLKSKGASGVGDVWTVAQETRNPHPAPFPLELPARAIETTGARCVLDCFMGSGTTLVAARDAGIRAMGIELESRWCEYTVQRLTGARRPRAGQAELTFTEAGN